MHAAGRGVPVDEVKARELLKKACDLGVQDGCTAL
jgi:TPR repeat protein